MYKYFLKVKRSSLKTEWLQQTMIMRIGKNDQQPVILGKIEENKHSEYIQTFGICTNIL